MHNRLSFRRAAYDWAEYPRVLAVVFVGLRLIAVNKSAEDDANIIQLYFDRPPPRRVCPRPFVAHPREWFRRSRGFLSGSARRSGGP